MLIDAGYEERYWYPDDGGEVWVAGYQLVDPESGRYLARDAPELAARGLHVVGVAGAGTPPRRRAGHRRGRARQRARACAAIRTTRTTRTRSPSIRPAAASRWAGFRASWPRSWRAELDAGEHVVGARAARAAPLAARPAPRPDDAPRARARCWKYGLHHPGKGGCHVRKQTRTCG